MHYELKTRQICLFLIAFLPVTKFFTLPSLLANITKEDMWISTLISIIITAITISFILSICTRSNLTLFEIFKNAFGEVVSKIILFAYALIFILKGVLPIIEQQSYIELTLFFSKYQTIFFMPLLVFAFILCLKQMRAIGRLSDIFWVLTITGFLLLFALSVSNANFNYLLPFFANSTSKILKASYVSSSWFSDAIYLLFFLGEFKYHKGDAKKILLSYFIGALMVLLFMIVFYCTFSSIAFKQIFALTESTKYTSAINNIGRFDYLGIMLLLCSGIVSLSLPLYFATHIICKIFNVKKRWIVALIITSIYVLPLTVLSQYTASIIKFITEYSCIIFILFGNVFPIITAFLPLKEKIYEK